MSADTNTHFGVYAMLRKCTDFTAIAFVMITVCLGRHLRSSERHVT